MTIGDTGWQSIKPVSGDGENTARGEIELVRGNEPHPCMMCRSWEKDTPKLVQHLKAHGLEQMPDGTFQTPIAKDIPGRKSLVIDPNSWGFCRLECRPTDMLATCENFVQVRLNHELASRISRR